MSKQDLSVGAETLRRMAKVDRYHQWLMERMAPHIGAKVLEVGCGTGNVTRELIEHAASVISIDLSPEYIDSIRQEFGGREGFEAVACDICDPAALELARHQPDTAVCLNVLEHIQDDRGALAAMHAILRPGGTLVLFVPALPALYGSLDRALDHHRRYRKRALSDMLREIGFETIEARYMNFPGLFGWYLNSRILRRQLLPEGQLALYNRLVPLFKMVDRLLGPPVGQSLFFVCRKAGVPTTG